MLHTPVHAWQSQARFHAKDLKTCNTGGISKGKGGVNGPSSQEGQEKLRIQRAMSMSDVQNLCHSCHPIPSRTFNPLPRGNRGQNEALSGVKSCHPLTLRP